MNEDRKQMNMAQSVRELKENMPAMLEMEELMARIRRERFMRLVMVGFTERQALYLCHPNGEMPA